ncbi:lysosomal aspartic protease [Orussus abietinus]|uniref:lysosomal aspartic protease n=1 Tax=Orussus abietinus TaxID=222816 RepID=UPI000625A3DA|nr:lysosomal aspartic protease [Orussus abietinus]
MKKMELLRVFYLSLIYFQASLALEIDLYRQSFDEQENRFFFKPHPNPWDNNDSVALNKFMNSEYYGIIKVGNPAKDFKFIFDTSWADVWIPSQHCGLTEIACRLHARYDGLKSSTYKENGTLIKINGSNYSLEGIVSIDEFHLPHLPIKNQSFIEMTHMSWIPFALQAADGYIGLGFQSLSNTGTTPLFYNFRKQYTKSLPIVTFYMNRDATTDKAGKVIFGGVDRKHLNSSLTEIPVKKKEYWEIQMDRMVVDFFNKSYPVCQTGCTAIIDTSTQAITGPPKDITRINNLLEAIEIFPFWPYRYMVNCREYAKLPDVELVFLGKSFIINSRYYIDHLTYQGVEICLSPFVPDPTLVNIWEIGGAFLMQFYTEYNYDKGTISIGKTVF